MRLAKIGPGCAALLVFANCTAFAASVPSTATTLDAAGVTQQIIGHTVIVPGDEEYYDPNGTIYGWLTKKNRYYTGKWDMDGAKLCFHYHTVQDSDYCRAVAVDGSQVYFILDNGEADKYSPGVIKDGNPDKLVGN